MWQAIDSLFAGFPKRARRPDREEEFPSTLRIPIIALVWGERDKQVLRDVAIEKTLELCLAGSFEDASEALKRFAAPVVIVDRDWPGTDWRVMVRNFASIGPRACTILMSGVTDEHLWEEVLRLGGYDVVTKPLRAQETARAITLALSYWRFAGRRATAVPDR